MTKPFLPPIPHSYWVLPGRFCAGEHPGSTNRQYAHDTIHTLLHVGIATFIDLTEEPEWVSYEEVLRQQAAQYSYPLEYWRQAIPDRQTPTINQMTAILHTIDANLATGRMVYLHCLAGIGRTGTVVGCYLVRHGMVGADVFQTLAHLRRNAADADIVSPETEEQRSFVNAWKPRT
jgi:hypothetical protein